MASAFRTTQRSSNAAKTCSSEPYFASPWRLLIRLPSMLSDPKKANAYTGMKMQYPPEDVTEVDVRESGSERIVTPKADLKPGEYVIFTGTPTPMPTGYGGYDFSVVASK
jgi:hypothetical protein